MCVWLDGIKLIKERLSLRDQEGLFEQPLERNVTFGVAPEKILQPPQMGQVLLAHVVELEQPERKFPFPVRIALRLAKAGNRLWRRASLCAARERRRLRRNCARGRISAARGGGAEIDLPQENAVFNFEIFGESFGFGAAEIDSVDDFQVRSYKLKYNIFLGLKPGKSPRPEEFARGQFAEELAREFAVQLALARLHHENPLHEFLRETVEALEFRLYFRQDLTKALLHLSDFAPELRFELQLLLWKLVRKGESTFVGESRPTRELVETPEKGLGLFDFPQRGVDQPLHRVRAPAGEAAADLLPSEAVLLQQLKDDQLLFAGPRAPVRELVVQPVPPLEAVLGRAARQAHRLLEPIDALRFGRAAKQEEVLRLGPGPRAPPRRYFFITFFDLDCRKWFHSKGDFGPISMEPLRQVQKPGAVFALPLGGALRSRVCVALGFVQKVMFLHLIQISLY